MMQAGLPPGVQMHTRLELLVLHADRGLGCERAALPMELGMLPLPRDQVTQSLDVHALTLLCPPPLGSPLSVSFTPWRCEAGAVGCRMLLHSASCGSEAPC